MAETNPQTAYIAALVAESVAVKQNYFAHHTADVLRAGEIIADAFARGHKLLLCGNGGSACDAQHIAGEFVNRFLLPDRKALPALALTTDGGLLTCLGNDAGFDIIFARQIEAFGTAGDVLLALTTSGNSPNVLAAIATARARGLTIIGLLGRDGGKAAPLCDLALTVPSPDTPRIQETHNFIGHLLCDLVERQLFADE